MHCPKCHTPTYRPPDPCPNCQFQGDPALSEQLVHVNWLLTEVDSWSTLGVGQTFQQAIKQKYRARQQALEVALGFRLPPFTGEAAREAWLDLIQREILLDKVADWLENGLVNPAATQVMVSEAKRQVENLRERLAGHPRPNYPQTDSERLDIVDFLVEAADYLQQSNSFSSLEAKRQVLRPLLTEQSDLEIKLGLRPGPAPASPTSPEHSASLLARKKQGREPASKAAKEGERPAEAEIADQPAPASAVHSVPNSRAALPSHAPASAPGAVVSGPAVSSIPKVPLGERLWRTLLSERTLQAILFLGIFLLFSAALSFVVWGWKDFSAPLRVAIPTGFTALFFGLGWFVRTKTALYRSGIALSAIAALLIPIDFYTIYVNFNIQPDFWPSFWLITSLLCLAAYTAAALSIGSRFFGYLVGAAGGSTVLAVIEAGHQALGLSLDWRTAGLSALALGLIIVATVCVRHPGAGRWRVLAEPFRYLSLLTIGVLLPLTFGWRFIWRDTYDTLHYALMVNWWLGGFIFGWGAIFYRSRSLGLLAGLALPVATYLAQAALFDRAGIHPAWHAFGWAWLVPLYFMVSHKLSAYKNDPVIQSHGQGANRWGVALLIVAAVWSLLDLTNGAAAASSHALLTGAVVLAALLWQRPNYLYAASVLSFSAATFLMTELDLTVAQLSAGWASLALAHIIVAVNLGTRFPIPIPNYAGSLVLGGYSIAVLALLPPIFPYDGRLLLYALGNWLGLTAWGARLAYAGQPGFVARSGWRKSVFHWLTAWSLPLWLWLLFANRQPPDFTLPLAFMVLAWAMIGLAYRLARIDRDYRSPWYLSGGLVSMAAPVVAFIVAPNGFTPAIVLVGIGLLYFADAMTGRHSGELAVAGFVTAWGYLLFLSRLNLTFDAATFGLALLIALYFLAGLWTERRKSAIFSRQFLAPLYLTGHILTAFLLWRIYIRAFNPLFFNTPWTDEMRLWGGASQLLLSIVYALYAWSSYKERWGHLAAWLVAAGGGFIALVLSTGQGSSAAIAALLAFGFVLAERRLKWLRRHSGLSQRQRALIRLAWPLYRRPLLVTGWAVSAAVIGLALIRNLWLLGSGRVPQIWAIVGLLLITGLYALSARLFRRARFMWLAAILIFAPWTILTHLGWFTPFRPTGPGFAISWIVLAWGLFLVGLRLSRLASPAYGLPLKTAAHVLLPFSLLWGAADVDTSRVTFGLAVGLYGLAAWLDYGRLKSTESKVSIGQVTKFLYLALGLIPIWSVYLMAWLLPSARPEQFGLMLLAFGPLGLAAGQTFKHAISKTEPGLAIGFGQPAYLTGYLSMMAATVLVASIPPLLALVLLFDAALLVVSAWLFKEPLWLYPALIIVPFSLAISLHERDVAGNRQGWWLIGLAANYLLLTWALRRAKLSAYSRVPLLVGSVLIAISLFPSSQDQTGALWGYGSAALLYAIMAFWLKQPGLLLLTAALVVVPYAIILQRLRLWPGYYGLALFPGAVAALAAGWVLDALFGRWQDFPWGDLMRWPAALVRRFLRWWALPLYLLGFGLAMASPFFTGGRAELSALNYALLAPLFGWAIYRFRLRVWLVAVALAGHLALILYLDGLGWWRFPAWAWLRFMPLTITTMLIGLFIQWRRAEASPLAPNQSFRGWSHPLYVILALDITIAQLAALEGTWAGASVTIIHALLIAVLASVWRSSWLAYVSLILGVVTVGQWGLVLEKPIESLPVALAQLALAYGLPGYGLALLRRRLEPQRQLRPWLAVWELPWQRFSMGLALGTLVLTSALGLDIVGWTVRALLGFPFKHIVNTETVWMVVTVLSLLGLLYTATAFIHRWLRLAYIALGMLGASWGLYAFYIQQWDNLERVQLYAIPAGLYLLAIAYLEWQRGNKALGRWLDYAAMLLMMGSLFWQTLLFGWGYALLLGAEGFGAFWWGSARRLRRFFYAGMGGVILATLGQLINSLRSINQWIVFGIIGLLLVIIAVFVERKLEEIKVWQEKMLETWE